MGVILYSELWHYFCPDEYYYTIVGMCSHMTAQVVCNDIHIIRKIQRTIHDRTS